MASEAVSPIALLTPLPGAMREGLVGAGYEVVEAGEPGAQSAQAAVTRGSLVFGDAELAALPRLRLLCCWGAGYDGIDLAAAARRGVTVANAPGGNASGVADLAIGFVIALMRQLPLADRHVRSGGWRDHAIRLPPVAGLTGARLGIFGFGEVGRRVALRAQALEMEVGACSRKPAALAGVRDFADLQELARWADVLVVAAAATPQTRHAIDEGVLRALGPQGMLVNVARGTLVDEDALCRVLSEGALAGFASDVFEHEPAVPPAILAFPNTVLSPHIGGATHATAPAQVKLVLANLEAFFRTGAPLHPVSGG